MQHNPKLSARDWNFWETLSQKPLPETYSQRMWKVSSSRPYFLHLESVTTPFKVRCLPNGVLPCQQASHQSYWSLFPGLATVWCQRWVLNKADYLRLSSCKNVPGRHSSLSSHSHTVERFQWLVGSRCTGACRTLPCHNLSAVTFPLMPKHVQVSTRAIRVKLLQ